ncbi:signal peptidase II [Rhodobacteraceae bacterium DSL-40]|uniref:signal peptidase II n=1 Tax=Amaricoccus sp. B4 TaxID=3368557 RepID=UPI000DAB6317
MLARALAVAIPVFLADRITKYWVVEALDLRHRLFIPVLDPWLNFTMAWNEGINFGLLDMGGAGRWVLIVLALAITIGLAVWVRHRSGWGTAAGVGAIMGGAIGNVWDRLQYGAVADFLNTSCCGIHNPFAFNVADAGIFVGAVLIAIFARDKKA